MIKPKLREYLKDEYPNAIIFDNPNFDHSIIGLSEQGSIIYDLEKMINELMNDEGMSYDEAYEFIDYNTIRSISYSSSIGDPPIIIVDTEIISCLLGEEENG